MDRIFQCGRFILKIHKPLIMGIVNITPDSFSDGGLCENIDAAIHHSINLISEGADILDIGGESTRPGANSVSDKIEIERLLPVIKVLRHYKIPLSVDTSKPKVMDAVLDAGADMINDVYGFIKPNAINVVASSSKCGLCIVHMKGTPKTMQILPNYIDIISEIKSFWKNQINSLLFTGIMPNRLILDPGFGFGKTINQNYFLLNRLKDLNIDSYPILTGLSRKSMIGDVTDRQVTNRLSGSIAAALASVARGASILRVHDVSETKDALNVWYAIEKENNLE